jgi:hypothetical protein
MVKQIIGPPVEVVKDKNLSDEQFIKCFFGFSLDCEPLYNSKDRIIKYWVRKESLIYALEQKKDELSRNLAVLLSQAKELVFNFYPSSISK